MDKRIQQIYTELYSQPLPKQYLSELLNVTSKTVENTIKTIDEITYDKKLGAYRFINLLPSYIPYPVFLALFKESISNELIKNDFEYLSMNSSNATMIMTNNLSSLSKKIIRATIAINHNCVLEMEYKSMKGLETKVIRPHKIVFTGSAYYLIASYDERNKKNIGDIRSFALNGILSFKSIEYLKEGTFKITDSANAYGLISKDNYVRLKLEERSANFFKREGLLNKDSFEFLSEEADGTVFVKMYYNNADEVVRLLQSWMPQITIVEKSEIVNEIYNRVKVNYELLNLNREDK